MMVAVGEGIGRCRPTDRVRGCDGSARDGTPTLGAAAKEDGHVSDGSAPSSTASDDVRRSRRLFGVRVLVVEDDPDIRALTEDILVGAGATVEAAGSAAAAFLCLQHFQPHVVVSDIGMPEEDGHSFMRRVRALPGEAGSVPSVAVTAWARAQDRDASRQAGFNLHLGKPTDPTELVKAVADLVGAG